MRRSFERLGAEPWTSMTWCSDICPAPSSTATPWLSSTSTSISWPRVRRLSLWKVSRCATGVLWLAGMNFMQPLTRLAGVKATQAVITSGLSRPQ